VGGPQFRLIEKVRSQLGNDLRVLVRSANGDLHRETNDGTMLHPSELPGLDDAEPDVSLHPVGWVKVEFQRAANAGDPEEQRIGKLPRLLDLDMKTTVVADEVPRGRHAPGILSGRDRKARDSGCAWRGRCIERL
jgi:hypothetical protein